MIFNLPSTSPRLLAAIKTAIVALSAGALAVLAAAGYVGAIFTTDQFGTPVNQNIYQMPGDVYLNGGPNNSTSQGLPPNEIFYFEVSDPSGQTILSTDKAACRQVQTDSNGRIAGPYTGSGCWHGSGTLDPTNGGKTVRLWPFSQTPNSGGEYKVTLVRKNAPGVSVDESGNLDYPRAATKTDNFKVVNFVPPTDGNLGSGGGNTGGGGCCTT